MTISVWWGWCTVGILTLWFRSPEVPEECTPHHIERIKACLKKGQILNPKTFLCHNVNTQGGCVEGERLFLYENSQCRSSKCVSNKCPDGELLYQGKCYLMNSERACKEEGFGKRLQRDLYGGVTCRCAVDLGYVNVSGDCYHEYMRGPCMEGKHLVRNGSHGGRCEDNTCGDGTINWVNGSCYQIENTVENCTGKFELVPKSGEEGLIIVEENQNVEDLFIIRCNSAEIKSSGTFDNCKARSQTDGSCLVQEVPPVVEEMDLLNILDQLNNLSGESEN